LEAELTVEVVWHLNVLRQGTEIVPAPTQEGAALSIDVYNCGRRNLTTALKVALAQVKHQVMSGFVGMNPHIEAESEF
jgi:hypothetical protein